MSRSFVSRLLRLILLAPDIVETILEGSQPNGVRLEDLTRAMSSGWEEQRRLSSTGSPLELRAEWVNCRDSGPPCSFPQCGPGDLDDKDRILAALVHAVHAGADDTEVPEAILWLALWPGLDALYRRLWRNFRDAHEDLISEIAVHFTLAIHRADLTRIRCVAAALLRNVERDVRSTLQRAREERARLVELPDHDDQHEGLRRRSGFAGGPGLSAFGISPGSDADQETRQLRDRLFQEIGAHADLVVAVVIVGERPGEIADRLGISPEAARKRCQRALDCLRQRLSER